MIEHMAMEARHDWNRLGPSLPPWFRPRLKRIDPRLVCQFIPPRSLHQPGGVAPDQFPHGVWAICRKLPTGGWLFKRWTWNLSDSHGRYQPPGQDTIAMIRMARDVWRSGNFDMLEDEFARSTQAIQTAKCERSRQHLANHISAICRKYDMTAGHGHVFMRDSIVDAA